LHVVQLPEASQRTGLDEAVVQRTRDRKALLQEGSGLVRLVAAQGQLAQGAQGMGLGGAVAELPKASQGALQAGGVGVPGLKPVDGADPLQGVRLAVAVADPAMDRQGLGEEVHGGVHAVPVQAEVAQPAQQRRLPPVVAGPTAAASAAWWLRCQSSG
jgi:hypothetical protein